MSSKPDQYEKAKQIYETLKNSKGVIDSIETIWKALDQSWSAGYRYAVANDWWQTQEAEYKIKEIAQWRKGKIE